MARPTDIVISSSTGKIYISDYSDMSVQIFNSSGVYQSKFGSFGTGNGQFDQPHGLALDMLGNIYVADYGNNRIQKFDSSGNYISQFGSYGTGNGQFSNPVQIAIATTTGNIYVVDQNNHRIQIFNSSGTYISQFGSYGTGNGQLNQPLGITISTTTGNIYIAEYGNNRVQVFDINGNYLAKIGSSGVGELQFDRPVGIETYSNIDMLYVTDYNNNRIQRFVYIPITISTTSITMEESQSKSYTVVLDRQPSGNVTVSLSASTPISGSGLSFNSSTLTFTTSNWNTPQTVTITATNDSSNGGYRDVFISASLTSSDERFNNLLLNKISVGVIDDDKQSITTCTDLQNMSSNLNGFYQLSGDIDCSASSGWNAGAGFDPVGVSGNPFTGRLYGNNYRILNLTINRPYTDYVGIFGIVSGTSTLINNLTITGNVTGHSHVGVLSGDFQTLFDINNISIIANITSDNSYVGGIAGYVYSSRFHDAYKLSMSGDININTTDYMTSVGGLFGMVWALSGTSNIYQSSSTGNISISVDERAENGFGGMFGQLAGNINIHDVYSKTNVSVTSTVDHVVYAGGLFGLHTGVLNISNSYSSGNVTVNAALEIFGAAGFAGSIGSGSTISKVFSTGAVSLTSGITTYTDYGGLIGEYSPLDSSFTNSYYDQTLSLQSLCTGVDNPDPAGCTAKTDSNFFKDNSSNSLFSTWDFINVWQTVTSGYPILRNTPESPATPSVTTNSASSITDTTATLNANLDSIGSPSAPSQHGFAYGTNSSLTSVISTTTLGTKSSTGSFTSSVSSLSAETTYYVRAYATNSTGTSYGSIISFTTSAASNSGGGGGGSGGGGNNSAHNTGGGRGTVNYNPPQIILDNNLIIDNNIINNNVKTNNRQNNINNNVSNDISRENINNENKDSIIADSKIISNNNLENTDLKNNISESNQNNNSFIDNIALFINKLVNDSYQNFGSAIDTPLGRAIITFTAATALIPIIAVNISNLLFAEIPLSEPWLIPYRLLSLFMGIIGLKKKNRPWGTVYDSVTKQPLDPAYVSIINKKGEEVTSSFTDIDGRYGFLLGPGTYKMTSNKTHYTFPSKKLEGKTQDELYSNLYFGEEFTIDKYGELIIKNIPMDQDGFDWNEFTKKNKRLTLFYARTDIYVLRVATTMFIVGSGLAIISTIINPELYNFLILGLYVFIELLRMIGVSTKTLGKVTDRFGKPVSYAIVSVYSELLGQKLIDKVTDKYGRYYCIVPPGPYHISVQIKKTDESYELVYESEKFNSKNGIINLNIKI